MAETTTEQGRRTTLRDRCITAVAMTEADVVRAMMAIGTIKASTTTAINCFGVLMNDECSSG